jgi:hypothetical protein
MLIMMHRNQELVWYLKIHTATYRVPLGKPRESCLWCKPQVLLPSFPGIKDLLLDHFLQKCPLFV